MHAVNRIRLLTCGAVLVTALVIGLISLGGFRALVNEQQRLSLEDLVQSESRRLELALHELSNDVRLLASLPMTNFVAESAIADDEAATAQGDRNRTYLADIFAEALHAKLYYEQIRFIGVKNDGKEIVRVDRDGGGLPLRVSDVRLQPKGGRDYFLGAMRMPPSGVFFSRIDLNREHGEIEVPHRPMLRAAVRVNSAEGEPLGVVVVNLHIGRFLADLYDLENQPHDFYITNSDGDYLLHPDPAKTYGFDLGTPHRLQDEHPEATALYESDARSLTIQLTDDTAYKGLLHYRKAELFKDDPQRYVVLGVAASDEALNKGMSGVFRRAVGVTTLLIGAAVLVGVIAGRMQTRPLETLTSAAQKLAQGEAMPTLPTRLNDEVGDLARAFKQMADTIRQKEAELRESNSRLEIANEDLEHFVHIAAHDLREPLRKQRNLIDLISEDLPTGSNPEETEELLGCVSKCSLDMQALIDDFRALSHLKESHLAREPVALDALISEVLPTYEEELSERNVVVRFDEFQARPHVYPGLVSRLYDNLIRNALRHTQIDGFTLAFTATQLEDHSWQYGVSNTGSSIPDGKRNEFFKLFRKSADSEGSGVGLSICKKIIDRHRGKIAVDSEGSTVHVRFTFGGGADDDKIG
ncbi:Phytochrome-like protein cph1 [Pseudobythopirellula maris]|uniref:histidine kinase n=1 Tax=Pseudobythopirellula maris TaxID=2527991 RepID=A0A5C5ZPT3_9BACT|nr:sensor histidine kinase [Pseudobythopirellula maris]TWT88811.1 Phytochrome-like protein cph1 [Pseudobythopirellula maris]